MSARIDISEKNQNYLGKHRYLELTHFCRQYSDWKREYMCASKGWYPSNHKKSSGSFSDPTFNQASTLVEASDKIAMIERCANEASPELQQYILKAVTDGYSYPYLSTVLDIPCGKDYYYARFRKFYWLLDKERH